MSKLRSQFINSTIADLESLRGKILSAEDFSDAFVKEIFRKIHTIKGTAQVFGLEKLSRIAHELENVLSDVKNGRGSLHEELLAEGIAALKKSFVENDAENTDVLIEKIKNAVSAQTFNILPEMPEEILSLLSKPEIESFSAAFNGGKSIFFYEVYFATANFREKLLRFRQILENKGEIIATLSAAKKDSHLGFRFLFAGKTTRQKIQDDTKEFLPKIVFEILPINGNLSEILTEAAAHGELLAKRLNKKIEFEIFVGKVFLSDGQIKIVFDALLHLIKNAVSHAIEFPDERTGNGKNETGKIKIRFLGENGGLKIIVSDDGRGIDREKVRVKAIEKKMISENEDLNERELSNLIFRSEFSTAENLDEISGRGIGLSAVRKMIENLGGTVEVAKNENSGATFEIILPSAEK